MKALLPIRLAIAPLLAMTCVTQAGEIYQWVGADGKVHFGDVPPRDAVGVKEVERKVGLGSLAAETEKPKEPEAPPSIETALASGDECDYKQQQLATFKSAASLVETDALGREREYSAVERGLIISRIEREMTIACGDLDPREPE